jgi:hypothetical protein
VSADRLYSMVDCPGMRPTPVTPARAEPRPTDGASLSLLRLAGGMSSNLRFDKGRGFQDRPLENLSSRG